MLALKLSAAAFLLALYASAAVAELPVQLQEQQPATALAVHRNIDKVRDGIDAVQKFVDIFNSKIFEDTSVGVVAEILSKSLSFIVAIIDLIKGSQSEDPLVRFLREQFAEVNNKLDSIAIQLGDVKDLIEWSTARSIYARYELEILVASEKYDRYLKAPAREKEFRQKEFIDYFKNRKDGTLKLYMGVVERDLIVSSSLADVVKQYTKNHRNKVMSFLLAMNRLILRGAQMEIAYQALVQSSSAGTIIERDWSSRMSTYARTMKSVEDSVKSVWYNQMKSDANAFILDKRGLSNRDFSFEMYKFLADKFDWQYWIVVAYKDVYGTDKHFIRAYQAASFFRVAGKRNVVIGRANRKSSTWSKAAADRALLNADNQNHSSKNCQFWNEVINKLHPLTPRGATLSMNVCWGCDVWMTSLSSRRSNRAMTCSSCGKYKERVHAILFG